MQQIQIDEPVAFSLLFAVQAIHLEKEGNTVCDTSGETSTDGKIDDDTAVDEDVDDGSLEPQTGLIADSGTKEDEEYS